ncbi:MAG: helix-turn-helix transcriptional regulator [Proteobacteria bacterium]|nr:helix-turn-helix transcriptional regulator [Pseudomonadota bacterium]
MEQNKKNLFQKNIEINLKLKELTIPLFENSPINSVGCMSFFIEKGEYTIYDSNLEWVKFFLEESIDFTNNQQRKNLLKNIFIHDKNSYVSFWGKGYNNINNYINSALTLCNKNIGLSIWEKSKTTLNVFSFSTNLSNYEIVPFFSNNISMLNYYILYLNQKLPELTNSTQYTFLECQDKFFLKNLNNLQNSNLTNSILNQAHLSKIKLNVKEQPCYLTFQQIKIIYYLAHGIKTKQISDIMNISSRTVESHLENIKIKTSLYSRDALCELYYQELHEKLKIYDAQF